MLIVVHFSHLMYLDLNSELRQFERQYRNISVGFAIDQSLVSVARTDSSLRMIHLSVRIRTDNNIYAT